MGPDLSLPTRSARPGRLQATSDCERCRGGWISQPVNTVSSLAYVVAGASLARRAPRLPAPERRPALALAAAVAATGIGSVAYHGPGGRGSRWAHDTTLVAASGLLAQRDLVALAGRRPPGAAALAAVPAAAAVACASPLSASAQVVAGTLATAAGIGRRVHAKGAKGAPRVLEGTAIPLQTGDQSGPQRGHSGRRFEHAAAGAVWTAGAIFHLTGRTGGPLCRPDSRLQAHAAWHLLSALGLWLAARRPAAQ